MHKLSINFPEDLYEALEVEARMERRWMAEVVRRAVAEYLARVGADRAVS